MVGFFWPAFLGVQGCDSAPSVGKFNFSLQPVFIVGQSFRLWSLTNSKGERGRWTSSDFVMAGYLLEEIRQMLRRFAEVLQVITQQNKLDMCYIMAGLAQTSPQLSSVFSDGP